MNIYFACSITGGREYENIYQQLTRALLGAGHVVPTAHLAESNILDLEKIVRPSDVYTRDVNWIQASDMLIAEISVPSHGVGYEIGFALNLNKPVLCLYQEGRTVSKMITGNPHPNLHITSYVNAMDAITEVNDFVNIVTSKL